MTEAIAFWPPQASEYATHIDALMWGFTAVIVLLTGPVFLLIIYFSVKYRRSKPADREHAASRSVGLETAWAVGPFLLTIGFFVYAAWLFFIDHRPPADALTIDVVAKQWMWKFQHPEGQRELDDLHVPAGQAVRLRMISQDVIHSLYVPALRLKQDVLPGRYTELWFVADRPGDYPIRCAEFCGADHALMGGALHVMRPADYARWLKGERAGGSLVLEGATLYRRLGCSGCHEAGGIVRAPPLDGLAGRPTPLSDGRMVMADAQYLRDSILLPGREIAAGYAPVMPTFANVLSEDQVQALVAYLQSRPAAPEAAR